MQSRIRGGGATPWLRLAALLTSGSVSRERCKHLPPPLGPCPAGRVLGGERALAPPPLSPSSGGGGATQDTAHAWSLGPAFQVRSEGLAPRWFTPPARSPLPSEGERRAGSKLVSRRMSPAPWSLSPRVGSKAAVPLASSAAPPSLLPSRWAASHLTSALAPAGALALHQWAQRRLGVATDGAASPRRRMGARLRRAPSGGRGFAAPPERKGSKPPAAVHLVHAAANGEPPCVALRQCMPLG